MMQVALGCWLLASTLAAAPGADAEGPADTAEVGIVEAPQDDPTVFPDPAKFARGFFVEGAVGPLIPVGPTSDVLSPGFGATARVGYEIRRWFALAAHATGSVSRYDDGVLDRELFQQFWYLGEARFGIPFRRFLIAVQGGAGVTQVSSNLLQIAEIAPDNRRFAFSYDASVAFDIHSLSRHFSGGLVATYFGVPAFDNAGAVTIGLYLRYTR